MTTLSDAERKRQEMEAAWERHRAGEPPRSERGRIVWSQWQPGLIGRLHAAQGGRCHWCARCMNLPPTSRHDGLRATLDHVIRLADGGPDEISNLVAACWDCNQRRGRDEEQASMPPRSYHFRRRRAAS